MSKTNKLHLDIKLVSLKTKNLLNELDKLNENIINDLDDTNEIEEIILINKMKLLYNTIKEFPSIVENSLSEDLRESIIK